MPTKFYGRPRELVGIHAKSWAPISRNMDGHHALMDTHDTYCGHPAHYRGRSCYADGVPRLFLGAHEKNVDFHAFLMDYRNIFVDGHETCLDLHGKYVEPHAFSWVATKGYGSPPHNRGRAS